jgi:DNA-directed RNA polymerase subunit RPC12/RpoP
MRFVCFKCGAKVFAPDEKVGAVAPCPKCGERLQVPAGLSDAVSLPQALLVADLVKQYKRTSPPLP